MVKNTVLKPAHKPSPGKRIAAVATTATTPVPGAPASHLYYSPRPCLRRYPERARTGVRPKRHWDNENDLSTNISLPVLFSILDD